MNWYTRPQDQGQIVEISYAYAPDNIAWKRVHDRSDRTTTYYHGVIDWDREPEGEDTSRAPCVLGWFESDAPREDEEDDGGAEY